MLSGVNRCLQLVLELQQMVVVYCNSAPSDFTRVSFAWFGALGSRLKRSKYPTAPEGVVGYKEIENSALSTVLNQKSDSIR